MLVLGLNPCAECGVGLVVEYGVGRERAVLVEVEEVVLAVLAVSTDPTLKTWLSGEPLCKTR